MNNYFMGTSMEERLGNTALFYTMQERGGFATGFNTFEVIRGIIYHKEHPFP
jgi:hypothetical protein